MIRRAVARTHHEAASGEVRRSRTLRRLATCAITLAACFARHADAQVVVGTVRLPDGQPVPLAHVYALDSVGDLATAVGVLTDPEGRFRLQMGTRRAFLLGVRRIGFMPEPARTLDWSLGDTLRLDVTLRAIPYQLPAVYAGTGICQPLSALPREHQVRALWDAAMATIAAREAFLNEYVYTREESHMDFDFATGTRHYDTTFVVSPPPAPLAPDLLSRPLGTVRKPTLFNRRWSFRLRSPGDRVLLHPDFAKRFCVDDRVSAGEGDVVEVHFREHGRSKGDVQVSGILFFRPGIAGPSRVEWRYEIDGAEIGRAEQDFVVIDVDGTGVPLVTAYSMQTIDPRTGQPMGKASLRVTFSRFVRVESPSR